MNAIQAQDLIETLHDLLLAVQVIAAVAFGAVSIGVGLYIKNNGFHGH